MLRVTSLPHGCTWERYVETLTSEHGGLTALTQLLIRRAGRHTTLPDDPGSIERALRRLRSRGNEPGGQYGRWLLKHFGVPHPLEQSAKWMGQYHSRFSDLPRSLRESQLWLWDRPPIAESAAAGWIHLGLASIALERGDLSLATERHARAAGLSGAGRVESELLAARLDSELSRTGEVERRLAALEPFLAKLPRGDERDCYFARWIDQRAYAASHATRPRYAEARSLYASIPEVSTAAFARFRRHHGLAYCEWRLGRTRRAVAHAEQAIEHAGDAGLLRFRAQALGLLVVIAPKMAAKLKPRIKAIKALTFDD
jgi:tetratricopeptide (TPR) repeat protein